MGVAKGNIPWNKGKKVHVPWNSGSRKTRFKNGRTPWNKGISYEASGRNKESCFKAGQTPINHKAVGTITVRIDKQKKLRRWIKVAEPNVWLPYAQWLWQETFGLIPKGLLVHHKDNDTMNDVVVNYELVTRATHINEHRSQLVAARLRTGEHVGKGYIKSKE